jgi:hypothetical protein
MFQLFNSITRFALVALFFTVSVSATITYQPDIAGVNGLTAVDKVSWTDSKGWTRSAYFAKGSSSIAMADGYITRFEYNTAAATTITLNEPSSGGDLSGLCYTVNHNSYNLEGNGGWTIQKEQGSNFSLSTPIQGPSHLIYHVSFLQKGDDGSKQYKVTLNWSFYEGCDYFVYSITYDCMGQTFGDDSRSPYSEFDWDGDGQTTGTPITGMSFGTAKVFMASALSTTNPGNSSWTYTQANTIPYVWEWLDSPSRECGYVQTQTQTQNKGGGGDWIQGTTGTVMPENWRIPYQMNCYQGYWGNRITWGVEYASLAPFHSWTLAIMLDQKSDNGVDNLIKETERIHNGTITFTAGTNGGTVVTMGHKGAGDTTTVTYSPAGFNHTLRTFEITAPSGNQARFNFNLSSGTFQSPTFVVHNWTAAQPPVTVTKNGVAQASGTGYYASVDDPNNLLFITMIGSLTGNNDILLAGQFDPTVPGSATGVSAVTLTPGVNRITWTDEATVTGETYSIYRSTSAITAFTGTPIKTGLASGVTGFNDTLDATGTFFYAVQAVSMYGVPGTTVAAGVNATASGLVSEDKTACAAPTDLAIAVGNMKITLTWKHAANADLAGFRVYRGVATGALSLYATTGIADIFNDTVVTDGTKYYYQVASIDNETTPNESQKTAEVSATARSATSGGLSFFTDAKNLIKTKWNGPGVFTIDTSGVAYEGKRCIKYAYSLSSYWDGFGTRCLATDVTGTTALRIAGKGPTGTYVLITLISGNGGTLGRAAHYDFTPNWTLSDLPLTEFAQGSADTLFDMTKLTEIRFDVYTGAASGTGTIYLDNIIFMGASPNVAINSFKSDGIIRGLALTAKNDGLISTNVYSLNGMLISRRVQQVKTGMSVICNPKQEAVYSNLRRGTYIIRLKGAGISYDAKFIR